MAYFSKFELCYRMGKTLVIALVWLSQWLYGFVVVLGVVRYRFADAYEEVVSALRF